MAQLVRLAVIGALTFTCFAFGASPSASGKGFDRSFSGKAITIAHANIKSGLSREAFKADLGRTMASRPDFVSLNEVFGRKRADMWPRQYGLMRLPRIGNLWETRSTAVMWRKDRWTKVNGGRERLVDHGPRRNDWGRSATWVTLQESVDGGAEGQRVSVISAHHMMNPKRFGPNTGYRQHLYAKGMVRLRALVERLSDKGPVLVAGDFNTSWRQNDPWGPTRMLGPVGMKSSFDFKGAAPTHDGGGTVDFTFFKARQLEVTRQYTRPLQSDHRALIVRLKVKADKEWAR
ncbi:MAG: endonuclease/exonuclease/phosphatase family protein [Nocardioides sp.]